MTDRSEPVIVATARSPIGRANKGSLGLTAEITDVVCGNVAQTASRAPRPMCAAGGMAMAMVIERLS